MLIDPEFNKAKQQVFKDIVIKELPVLKPDDHNYYQQVHYDPQDTSKKYPAENIQQIFNPQITHPHPKPNLYLTEN